MKVYSKNIFIYNTYENKKREPVGWVLSYERQVNKMSVVAYQYYMYLCKLYPNFEDIYFSIANEHPEYNEDFVMTLAINALYSPKK